jgi:nucleoside-diphosphate-sugar epimerase
MKVLVMGGTQFNGLALVRELVRSGHDVTVLNRGRSKADLPRAVRRLYGDRTDHAALRALLARQEFDCVQDMSAYHPEDVKLMHEIFRGRIGHYVFASSTVIYAPSNLLPIGEGHPVDRGPEQNEYGLHKLLCEDFLVRKHREEGFPATIVPLSMVFGPNNILPDREQRMFVRLLRGRKILIPGDGTTVGQVGHVDDQARALRLLMGRPQTFGKRYNLTGRQLFSDEGYVDTMADVLGVEPEKVFIPAHVMDDLWDGRLRLEMGAPIQSDIDIRTSEAQRARAAQRMRLFLLARIIQRLAPHLHRWNRSVFFDITALRRDTGWEPEYTFRSMVEQTYEWFLATGRDETSDFDFEFEDRLLAHLGKA